MKSILYGGESSNDSLGFPLTKYYQMNTHLRIEAPDYGRQGAATRGPLPVKTRKTNIRFSHHRRFALIIQSPAIPRDSDFCHVAEEEEYSQFLLFAMPSVSLATLGKPE